MLRAYFGFDFVGTAAHATLGELFGWAKGAKAEYEFRSELANSVLSMTALEFIGFDPADWHDFAGLLHAFSRNVKADIEIGGQTIRAGERVYMLWASANRDPDKFENPDEVDFDRKPNRHLTFGIGAHRCLGAQLARLELRIMLEEILRRIPDFRVDLKNVRQPTSVTIIWGRTSLPATFSPTPLV